MNRNQGLESKIAKTGTPLQNKKYRSAAGIVGEGSKKKYDSFVWYVTLCVNVKCSEIALGSVEASSDICRDA